MPHMHLHFNCAKGCIFEIWKVDSCSQLSVPHLLLFLPVCLTFQDDLISAVNSLINLSPTLCTSSALRLSISPHFLHAKVHSALCALSSTRKLPTYWQSCCEVISKLKIKFLWPGNNKEFNSHFGRNTLLVPEWTLFFFQNFLNSWRHKFNKEPETFLRDFAPN